MASVYSGLEELTWAAKETSLAISNGTIADDDTDSPFVDLLVAGRDNLLPDQLMFSFNVSVSSAALIAMIYAIFSEDGDSYDPPTGANENKKILIASLSEAGTIARSNIYACPVLAQYFRLAYQNDGTASITMGSRYAPSFQQSYSA